MKLSQKKYFYLQTITYLITFLLRERGGGYQTEICVQLSPSSILPKKEMETYKSGHCTKCFIDFYK